MSSLYDWLMVNLMAVGLVRIAAAVLTQSLLVAGVVLLSFAVNLLAKKIILEWAETLIVRTTTRWDDILLEQGLFVRFSHFAPALVIYACAGIAFPDSVPIQHAIERIAFAYMILVTATVVDALLNGVVEIYRTAEISKIRPIKSYMQVVKLLVYLITGVLVISTLLDRSPWGFLSGLGALTAVIMLVFKDTILGFVASIQLATHKMVRRGDWIEMPAYGADGEVLDVTLNTVKIQNWDKSISTVPTYALVSETFKNWRGMDESGGRRIKRAVAIDMHSIKFCSEKMLDRFARMRLLTDYIGAKRAELAVHNQGAGIDAEVRINTLRLTNVGIFRAYVLAYLRNHPNIHQGMTLLVRQLPPGTAGVPIEIYAFCNDKQWDHYENIVADIFDHVLAVIPEFHLQVFQAPSGSDVRTLANPGAGAGAG